MQRLSAAWRVLFDDTLAARVDTAAPVATVTPSLPEPAKPEVKVEKVIEKVVEERIVEKVKVDPEAGALLILSVLQRDGRLVDFLMEDIAGASDADVGAGARIVHRGCKKVLQQYVTLEPVRTESEGSPVTVDKGFDPAAIRLSGNVTGEPPFKGKLAHAGWRAKSVQLPERPPSIDAKIVAPAEVEL